MLLVIAAALVALPAHADDASDAAQLREQAAALRRSLEELEARIRALESGPSGAPAASAAPRPQMAPEPSPVSVQRSWAEVRPGIAKQRVDALLGKPVRVLRIDGNLAWYYAYPGLGRGSVFFDAEDKVTAVQAPRAGLF